MNSGNIQILLKTDSQSCYDKPVQTFYNKGRQAVRQSEQMSLVKTYEFVITCKPVSVSLTPKKGK